MSPAALLVALSCTLAIIVFFFGLARFLGGSHDEISSRLERFATREGESPTTASGGDPKRGRITTELDKELSRRGKSSDTAAELARADLKLTPAEFFIVRVTATIAGGILGFLIFRQFFMVLPAGIAGYFMPQFYVRFRQGQRKGAFAAQLSDAINLLANSLRSGYSLPQSMELLSREMQPPIADEFGRVVREIGLGVPFEQALDNMVRRNKNDDLDLMVTAVLVNHEVGGNLAQVLEIIGHTVRERIRIKGEIQVLTAQQQMSGYVVGLMPFALTLFLFIINPEYMGELFHSLCGELLACTAFGMVGMAFVLIRKIVNIEV
jgi:tight adherence protein B